MKWSHRAWSGVACLVALVLCVPVSAYAQSSSSPSYRVDQTFFGSGGELDANSANYRAKQTAGELAVGNTASANYGAYAGFNTTDDPYLEFVVTGNNIDLGYLSTSQVSTANGTFYVRAWQSGGYVIRTEANPPTNTANGHMFDTPSSPTASAPGTEQFGMNLVANTSPTTFGANVSQANGFSVGQVATGYDMPNVFKYAKGDTIASASSSSSVTTYTLSYIFNINNVTPSGEYRFAHTIVATATY